MTTLKPSPTPAAAQPRRAAIILTAVLAVAAAVGALIAHQPLLTLAAILAGILGVAALNWPDSPSLLVLLILYLNVPVVAARFHGVPTVVAALAPAPLIVPLASYLLFRREKVVLTRGLVLLGVYLLIQITSTLLSRDLEVSFDALTTFMIEGIGLSFALLNVVRTPLMVRRAAWTLLVAGALLGSLSVYQRVTETYDNNYGGFAQVKGEGFNTGVETSQGAVEQLRLAGPIGEKNYYAQMMFMLVPLGFSLAAGERPAGRRMVAVALTGLISIGAVLTYSRGLAIGFIIVLLAMTLMRYIKPAQLVAVLVAVALMLELFPEFGVRLSSTLPIEQVLSGRASSAIAVADPSTRGRLGEMGAALLVFLDHPFLGVGPGMFKYYYPEYIERVGLQMHAGIREAHNLYLDVGADMGILGLSAFLAIIGVALFELNHLRARLAQRQPEMAHLAAGFMLAIISYLATGIFLSLAYERYLWMIVALAGALVSSTVVTQPTTPAPRPPAAS